MMFPDPKMLLVSVIFEVLCVSLEFFQVKSQCTVKGCTDEVKEITSLEEIKSLLQDISYRLQKRDEEIYHGLQNVKDQERLQDMCVHPHLAPRDCADIRRGDRRDTSGLYRIYAFDRARSNSPEVLVYCDMDTRGNSWLIFQRRRDGSVDFYRTWKEYADGFGNPNGEYWLGNEALYQLTSQRNYKLRVELENWSGEKRYAEYSKFSISSSADKYKLTVGGYSGNAGDSLASHNGMKFSTKDNRNDNNTGPDCATYFRGAWWFHDCYRSHLNGIYHRGGNYSGQAENKDGISWNGWYGVGVFYSLKTTEMKISPLH